jgi:hypothetical protein
MSELGGYYRAFGYQPVTGEPPDHVSVEAGFVAYLRLKEAFARTTGDEDHAAMTAEAASRFQKYHLARIAGPLAAKLSESGIAYLARAGQALVERAGPGVAPAVLPVLPDDPEDDACAGLAQ